MNKLEALFIWIALYAYLPGFALLLAARVFQRRWEKAGYGIIAVAFLAHTLSGAVRWVVSGHPPVQGNYENALLGAWFLILVYLVVGWRFPYLRPAGILVAPLATLILGMGLKGETAIAPLDPPYQSNWLWVHVGFAWLAFSSFFLAACLGAVYLWRQWRSASAAEPAQDAPVALNAGVPERESVFAADLARTEEIMLGLIIFGFVSQGFMIATGAIWAASLWGSYWSWDPIETWSLVCWLVYGLVLHLRFTFGWRGSRLAVLAVVAVLTVVISFWGLGIGQGVHTPLLGF